MTAPIPDPLASVRRFRNNAVLISIGITAASAIGARVVFGPIPARGIVLGGIAGILGFWIIAVRLQRLLPAPPEKVKFFVLTMSAYRFAMYGAALGVAFMLDRDKGTGLAGAVAGILIIRFVLVAYGVMRRPKRSVDSEEV